MKLWWNRVPGVIYLVGWVATTGKPRGEKYKGKTFSPCWTYGRFRHIQWWFAENCTKQFALLCRILKFRPSTNDWHLPLTCKNSIFFRKSSPKWPLFTFLTCKIPLTFFDTFPMEFSPWRNSWFSSSTIFWCRLIHPLSTSLWRYSENPLVRAQLAKNQRSAKIGNLTDIHIAGVRISRSLSKFSRKIYRKQMSPALLIGPWRRDGKQYRHQTWGTWWMDYCA